MKKNGLSMLPIALLCVSCTPEIEGNVSNFHFGLLYEFATTLWNVSAEHIEAIDPVERTSAPHEPNYPFYVAQDLDYDYPGYYRFCPYPWNTWNEQAYGVFGNLNVFGAAHQKFYFPSEYGWAPSMNFLGKEVDGIVVGVNAETWDTVIYSGPGTNEIYEDDHMSILILSDGESMFVAAQRPKPHFYYRTDWEDGDGIYAFLQAMDKVAPGYCTATTSMAFGPTHEYDDWFVYCECELVDDRLQMGRVLIPLDEEREEETSKEIKGVESVGEMTYADFSADFDMKALRAKYIVDDWSSTSE